MKRYHRFATQDCIPVLSRGLPLLSIDWSDLTHKETGYPRSRLEQDDLDRDIAAIKTKIGADMYDFDPPQVLISGHYQCQFNMIGALGSLPFLQKRID